MHVIDGKLNRTVEEYLKEMLSSYRDAQPTIILNWTLSQNIILPVISSDINRRYTANNTGYWQIIGTCLMIPARITGVSQIKRQHFESEVFSDLLLITPDKISEFKQMMRDYTLGNKVQIRDVTEVSNAVSLNLNLNQPN